MKRDSRLTECGGCGSEDPILLYNAGPRSSGIYRRLCPSCLLKSHRGTFCPFCFDLIDDSTPSPSLSPSPSPSPTISPSVTGTIMCRACHSLSHSSCVPSDASPATYHCPRCSDPDFLYFPSYPKKSKLASSSSSSSQIITDRTLDRDSAKALLAAVRISASSMAKAANVARLEAEKRVKEAAVAKKRAREALERVDHLAASQDRSKHNIKNRMIQSPPSNSNSNGNGNGNGGAPLSAAQKLPPNTRLDGLVLPDHKRIQAQPGKDGFRKPEVVSASLAAAIVPLLPKNGVSAEAKDKDAQKHCVKVEKETNGLHSPVPVEPPQHQQTNQ